MPKPRPKIYIESCPFIDLAKHKANVPFGVAAAEQAARERDVAACFQLLKLAIDGKIVIFTSGITVAECTHVGAAGTPDKETREFYEGLLASGKGGVFLVQPTQSIITRARKLRWDDGIVLGGVDGIHVASALSMGCAEFITTDGKIYKSRAAINNLGIAVIRAQESAYLSGEKNQYGLNLVESEE